MAKDEHEYNDLTASFLVAKSLTVTLLARGPIGEKLRDAVVRLLLLHQRGEFVGVTPDAIETVKALRAELYHLIGPGPADDDAGS